MRLLTSRTEPVSELLREMGYKAKIAEDGSIDSGMGGFQISVVADEDALQLNCPIGFDEGDGINLETINEYNSRYRFGKLYLAGERGIVLSSDFPFDPEWPNATDVLQQITAIYEAALRLLRDHLLAVAERASADQAETEISAPEVEPAEQG